MAGPTIVAIFSFGVQPTSMKNAVMSPQAMIAPMFGMIMLDKNVPNRWTWTRAPAPRRGVRCCGGHRSPSLNRPDEPGDADLP